MKTDYLGPVVLTLAVALSAFGSSLWGQIPDSRSTDSRGQPQTNGESQDLDAGNIDKLLDTADKDVGALSQVKVSSTPSPLSLDTPVDSVSKQPSTLGHSAAAVFVINQEMIHRSGATCIPEALRMAPGVDVARINSNTWAISARGFNGILSRNLLVLIDGRSVYSPVFGGVYWDVQDCVLEDVDRIEVIRGPGGTLWGANAVNGVINIITKKANDTQGGYLSAGGGTTERSSETFRYGGKIGEDCYYRVYGKYFDRGPFNDPLRQANDGWNQGRFGFRADWQPGRSKEDTVTIQGDHYVGTDGTDAQFTSPAFPYTSIVQGTTRNSGQNILSRWRHIVDEDAEWTLQTYYDDYVRDTVLLSEKVKTWDIEYQYRFALGERNTITWGTGYRHIRTDCPSNDNFTLSVIPVENALYVVNEFVQDEIKLVPDLWTFTIGCKLEQNSFTDFEYEPSARLLWTPDQKRSIWGAVSRAVHTPTVINETISSTSLIAAPSSFRRSLGSSDIQSESMIAFEIGYREQMTERFSYDLATFFNVYDQLYGGNSGTPYIELVPSPAHTVTPSVYANKYPAESYGIELATNWSVTERWRIYSQYTLFRSLFYYSGNSATGAGGTPKNQAYVMSSWNLRKDLDFDLMGRYVDCVPGYNVPAYLTMDARLAWRPRKNLEMALVGQNLLQAYHREYGFYNFLNAVNNAEATEVPRGVYGTIAWRF